jgi:hypothetical protein
MSPAQVEPARQADLLLYSEVIVRHAEGEPRIGYYLEKDAARLMGAPDGTIPSDSTALLVELDAPSQGADGNCKIKWKQDGVTLDVYVRRAHLSSAQVAHLERQKLPCPSNARRVRIRHAAGNKPDVVFHHSFEAAQRQEPPHGKIPNDEIALMTDQVPQGKHWVAIWYDNQNVFVRQVNVQHLDQ